MILSGEEIRRQVELGRIKIDPYNPEHLNPASYDLRLGDECCFYDERNGVVVDSKVEPFTQWCKIPPSGAVVGPKDAFLMHTLERVRTDSYVPVLDGKSSIGRLFVSVHQTAGFGDPGFDGQYTLEVTAKFPVRLYAGMRIAQIRFHAMRRRGVEGPGAVARVAPVREVRRARHRPCQ